MRFKITSAIALAATISLGAVGAQAEIVLRFHHLNPPPAVMHSKFVVPWAKSVAKATGGKIKVEIYPSMQLGGRPQQLIDQARDGVVDIAWTIAGYTPGRFPRLEVFELPFVHKTVSSTNRALFEFRKKHLQPEMKDYHILALHVHAGNVILTRNRPIRRVDDFRGMKIRIPNRTGGWFLKQLGANPIGTTVTEIPQLLSRGVIDGAALPFEIIRPFKLHELTKFHTSLDGGQRFQTTVFIMAMNKRKYQSLPAGLRAKFDSTTGLRLVNLASKVWEAAEAPGIRAAKARGNVFIRMSPAESQRLRKLAEPIYKRWIADVGNRGIDGRALLKDARALIEKYRQK